ncbi:MAG: DUF4397 domain-containing protein [Clostridia bacterium]|nr:DUF4397 domain-containing protein [Anaerotignum sp.]NCC16914.1 DUF4397 domain-containing protein [Clostridia bacterium]
MAQAENPMKGMQICDEIIFPLPLPKDEFLRLEEKSLTAEEYSEAIRKFLPEINIVPDVKNIRIPIIHGITLYSYLGFLNVFPSVLAIDIYVNRKKVVSGLSYGTFTQYQYIFPGCYRIQVCEAGKKAPALLDTFVHLIGYRVYTAAITGIEIDAALVLVNDSILPVPEENSFLRFVQLSSSAPVMDAYLEDRLILTEIDYRESSRYLSVLSGNHDLKIKDYISNCIIIEDSNLKLEGGNAYTVYIIGDINDKTGMQMLIDKDESNGINF